MKRNTFLLFVLFLVFSCKTKINYHDDSELCKLLTKMAEDDQKIRKMPLLDTGTKKQKDSLWNIQKRKDKKNIEILIEIIKERGWIDKKELKCDKAVPPVLIFRHAPEEYFKQIEKIISIENEAGRMSNGDYMFVENHLKGRPSFSIQVDD
ncbi:hypothetical protein WH52_11155 [Tenacibaculum holothuriorum]|uniref:Lipoprotein n=1 Tax=Tenacibaculum holothuriorum TaxID=1635173 RepID=A0A1Y2PBQ3_9FLAO|nr:hypothetical protein [Tenacibaculum holothuriorum]OSY87431.1 hypothetical protein WH52_11155 [Tenacibaculum holothuriorum]